MPRLSHTLLVAGLLAASAGPALADQDLEGAINALDTQARSFVVQGQTFFTTPSTDYDDSLTRFEDLRIGQRVEVDYRVVDGRKLAEEIELDD